MSPFLKYRTPQEQRHVEMAAIVKDVLEDDYWKITIDSLSIQEDLRDKTTKVSCIVNLNQETFTIEETGHGPIDALFNGLKNSFKNLYLSFRGLNICGFAIEGDIDPNLNMSSEVECVLSISSDNNFKPQIYRQRDASINRAAICVVLSAVEYYINSERAIKILRKWAADAQKRNRGDLFEQCVMKMSKLIEGASYTDTLVTVSKNHDFED